MTGVPPQPPHDSNEPPAPGWWMASDHNWYPPETHPDYVAPAPPPVAFTPPPLPAQPVYSPAVPGVPPAPGFSMVGAAPAPAPAGKYPRWLWPAVIAAVVVVGVGAFVLTRSGDDDAEVAWPAATAAIPGGDDSESASSADTGASVEPTSEANSSGSVTGGTGEFIEGCEAVGVDSFGDVQLALRFVNPSSSAASVSATFALRDSAGVRFVTSSVFVEAAQPQERIRVEHDTLEALPRGVTVDDIVCEVLEVEPDTFGDAPTVPPDASCSFVELDSFGDIQVELTVSNPFSGTTDLALTYALRGPDGVRFDTSTTWIELVAEGETVRTVDDSFTSFPNWVSEGDFSCEIVAVNDFS